VAGYQPEPAWHIGGYFGIVAGKQGFTHLAADYICRGLIHRPHGRVGVIAQAERAGGQPIVSPFMRDRAGQPVEGSGALNHGRVRANPSDRNDQ